MTQQVFTVYDSKAEQYLQPFVTNTVGVAERMFTELVNSEGHQFNRHPADYTLYRIGTFDSHDAVLAPSPMTAICTGLAVSRSEANALPFEVN